MADPELSVSTTGNDAKGDGTTAKPFRTIQKAAAELKKKLAAGQTGKILVAPGLYEEVVVLTSGMRLLRADEKEQVSLDIASEAQSELQPAVRLKRPSRAGQPPWPTDGSSWLEECPAPAVLRQPRSSTPTDSSEREAWHPRGISIRRRSCPTGNVVVTGGRGASGEALRGAERFQP